MKRQFRRLFRDALRVLLLLFCVLCACDSRLEEGRQSHRAHDTEARIVLKVQPLWGDLAPFRALIQDFERAHNTHVEVQFIPNASDAAHQYYLTALAGRAADFDVLAVDVIWVHEFARAGFIADLSRPFPPATLREQFLPGPVQSVVMDDRTFAVPWFMDVGVLYYRRDLVPRAPRTYDELERFARDAMLKQPGLYGYVWQAKQYEGLTCNVYEAVWGHGGKAVEGTRLALETPETQRAIAYLRHLLTSGLSPSSVTSGGEEEARRLFQEGRAVFMRNWPYALRLLEAPDSKIRGRVGVAPLPTRSGEPGPGALGGWQLAINAHSPLAHRAKAEHLIAHLTSFEANVSMAVHYARNPARRDAFASQRLAEQAPFIFGLKEAVERARPRPVTPYYVLLTDILQSEFSAAVTGVRSPEGALKRAQQLADHLTSEAL